MTIKIIIHNTKNKNERKSEIAKAPFRNQAPVQIQIKIMATLEFHRAHAAIVAIRPIKENLHCKCSSP